MVPLNNNNSAKINKSTYTVPPEAYEKMEHIDPSVYIKLNIELKKANFQPSRFFIRKWIPPAPSKSVKLPSDWPKKLNSTDLWEQRDIFKYISQKLEHARLWKISFEFHRQHFINRWRAAIENYIAILSELPETSNDIYEIFQTVLLSEERNVFFHLIKFFNSPELTTVGGLAMSVFLVFDYVEFYLICCHFYCSEIFINEFLLIYPELSFNIFKYANENFTNELERKRFIYLAFSGAMFLTSFSTYHVHTGQYSINIENLEDWRITRNLTFFQKKETFDFSNW